jgi:hypothetical protein
MTQIFLPYRSFSRTAKVLDYKRLGKQRVEALRVYNAITGRRPWTNQPLNIAWKPYPDQLWHYYHHISYEWIRRGYNHTLPLEIGPKRVLDLDKMGPIAWLTDEVLWEYQNWLYTKDPDYYGLYWDGHIIPGFNWSLIR